MPQQQNEFTENNSAAPAQGVEDTAEETPIIKKTDYELGVVPAGERKGWLPIAGIWIAIGIDLSGTILGVQLGAGMPFGQAIFATMLGSLLLGLFAMAATYVGAATGVYERDDFSDCVRSGRRIRDCACHGDLFAGLVRGANWFLCDQRSGGRL